MISPPLPSLSPSSDTSKSILDSWERRTKGGGSDVYIYIIRISRFLPRKYLPVDINLWGNESESKIGEGGKNRIKLASKLSLSLSLARIISPQRKLSDSAAPRMKLTVRNQFCGIENFRLPRKLRLFLSNSVPCCYYYYYYYIRDTAFKKKR